MEMQREDFMKLCKGPAGGGVGERWTPGGVYSYRTHDGMGRKNQFRVLNDWFPAGEIFQFLGATCFSRGVHMARERAPALCILAPSRTGGLEETFFSVKEALNIARQISVDRVNWLNRLEG